MPRLVLTVCFLFVGPIFSSNTILKAIIENDERELVLELLSGEEIDGWLNGQEIKKYLLSSPFEREAIRSRFDPSVITRMIAPGQNFDLLLTPLQLCLILGRVQLVQTLIKRGAERFHCGGVIYLLDENGEQVEMKAIYAGRIWNMMNSETSETYEKMFLPPTRRCPLF